MMKGSVPAHGGFGKIAGVRLDFSASINPLGMPESIRQAVIDSFPDWECYPDPECRMLRSMLAECFGTEPGHLVCGNGADDLIYRIVQAVKPGRAIICIPTFGEYEKALRQVGTRIEHFRLRAEQNFDLQEELIERITPGTDMVFVCNPNNPTGRLCERDFLERLAVKAAECGALLVFDECFMEFAGQWETETMATVAAAGQPVTSGKRARSEMAVVYGMEERLPGETQGRGSGRGLLPGRVCCRSSLSGGLSVGSSVIVLRAFTKICAMPGLRLGYALFGDEGLAERVADTGQYWSVSVPAQAAGIAAVRVLAGSDYGERTRDYIAAERLYLEGVLQGAGIGFVKSAANFILIYSERDLYRELLDKGILIRDCSDFAGLGRGWYRIAVRTHEENKCLAEALNEDDRSKAGTEHG